MAVANYFRVLSVVGLLSLGLLPAPAAFLHWTGAESGEWNTVHSNWMDGAVFQTGDAVRFSGDSSVFIGLDGVPTAVHPSRVDLNASVTFTGGDIGSATNILFFIGN